MARSSGTRGYAKWNPSPDARYWVARVNEVLERFKDYWPMTNRQIFYRLVAEHSYEKTEAGYNKLTQMVSRARRAGYLDWEAIRDGGLGRNVPAVFFRDANHFQNRVKAWAKDMHLDRQRGQGQTIELWCEAGGMVPILEGIAEPYSAQVNTGGGYDSVTAKHRLAERVCHRAEKGLKTLILHVGDFDGSGEDMCRVLCDDTESMVWTQILRSLSMTYSGQNGNWKHADWTFIEPLMKAISDNGDYEQEDVARLYEWACDHFTVERVALTGEQVVERQVITAPPKKSDSRSAGFLQDNWEIVEALGTDDISAQLEALSPPELHELVTEVLEARIDLDIYQEVLDEEEDVRAELARKLA